MGENTNILTFIFFTEFYDSFICSVQTSLRMLLRFRPKNRNLSLKFSYCVSILTKILGHDLITISMLFVNNDF